MYLGSISDMLQKIGDEALTIATVATKVHQGMDPLWDLLSFASRLLILQGQKKDFFFFNASKNP